MNRDVERILDALKADGFRLLPADETPTEIGNRLEIEKLHLEVKDLAETVYELQRQVAVLLKQMPENVEVFRQLQQKSQAMTDRSMEWRLRRLEVAAAAISLPAPNGKPE